MDAAPVADQDGEPMESATAPRPTDGGSWRHWAPRLLVLAGAVAAGLALQTVIRARVDGIQALAASDVIAARAQLAHLLQVVGGGVLAITTAFGVALFVAARRAVATAVFPPPGVWSWGAPRTVTGPRAVTFGRLMLALAAALVACSLTGLGMVFFIAQRLLQCRA